MSKRPQIHIFMGAPSIPSLLEASEQSSSAPITEKWRELHYWCDTHGVFSGKVKSADRCVARAAPTRVDSQQLEEERLIVPKEYMSPLEPVAATCTSTLTKTVHLICSHCQVAEGRHADKNVNPATDPHPVQKQVEQFAACCSDLTSSKAIHTEANGTAISDLVAGTKQVIIHQRSAGQGAQLGHRSDHHDHLNQYLEMLFPQTQESNPKGDLGNGADLAVSADTEFCTIMTSSQMVVLARDGGEMQKRIRKLSETGASRKPEGGQHGHFHCDSAVGTCLNVTQNECKKEHTSSLELYNFERGWKSICLEAIKQEGSAGEDTEKLREIIVPAEQLGNAICIEPLRSGILCSQADSCHKSFSKRAHECEDSFHGFPSAFKNEQKSKRVKPNSSPVAPQTREDQERTIEFKLQKKLSPLRDCCCQNQKYNVLVAVVHPCHVKEIQVKTRLKSFSNVPVATIVVTDQSAIERKVVLWRGAAFWSLTVFPGDIVLLTDIVAYENLWYGEIVLQSTFTSQLLNLGSSLALSPEEFYPVVDAGALCGLLAYISSEFPHFGDIPRRQVQKLDSIQYRELDQLQPNTLVHAILKIISIVILTESVYRYRGGSQRKIVLTVEQKRDQGYRMVLWGAAAAWFPQLRRKKDHIWDFKYLLVQRSSVSGDFELHTTPWSTCECLFDDDRRVVEFKEKFQKNKASLLQITKLSAHLEEKSSGMIRVRAQIIELTFTISAGQYKQLVFHSGTSLERVLALLPMMTYSGCAKCGLELQVDENMIYKQCIRCLPYSKMKTFYRPALMTVEDGGCQIDVHVASELMEKIFLNIPADWHNRSVVPSSDLTYSTIVAELCHFLLADVGASYLLDIRSIFVLDENSYPLQKDFHLLNFLPEALSFTRAE